MKKFFLLFIILIFFLVITIDLFAKIIRGEVISIENNKIKVFNLETKKIEEIQVANPSLFKKKQIIEYDSNQNKFYNPKIKEDHFIRRRIRELYRRRNFNSFKHNFPRGRGRRR